MRRRHKLVRRVHDIVVKWIVTAAVLAVLTWLKLWTVLFVYVPLLAVAEAEVIVDWGLGWQAYIAYHGWLWLLVSILVTALIMFEYYTHYARKRPRLVIGGQTDWRVVWIRGLRRGLAYDAWDVYHYLVDVVIRRRDLEDLEREARLARHQGRRLRWPDAWAIPLGRARNELVIYHRSSVWQWRNDRLYLPRTTEIGQTWGCVFLPPLELRNRADPRRPGMWDRDAMPYHPTRQDLDPARTSAELVKHLDRSRDVVTKAIMSDPETQKVDYVHGSFPLSTVK